MTACAALALSAIDADRAKLRIRAAAEACASRPVRIALEKTAADELDDEAVLEAIASEEATRRARAESAAEQLPPP